MIDFLQMEHPFDRITQNPAIMQALRYAAWRTEEREVVLAST